MFTPDPYGGHSLESLIIYVIQQFQKLANLFSEFEIDYVRYTVHHSAPEKPAEGMMFLADGSDWDPLSLSGSDAYFVWYTGSAYRGVHETAGGTNLS